LHRVALIAADIEWVLRAAIDAARRLPEPDRIDFDHGSLTFFKEKAVLRGSKFHPLETDISSITYMCNSKTLTCIITAGTQRIEVRRRDRMDFKDLQLILFRLL
jgi:hypothetical protein